jgi:hypothetical protein
LRHSGLQTQDGKLELHNKRLRSAQQKLERSIAHMQKAKDCEDERSFAKWNSAHKKAEAAVDKVLLGVQSLVHTGSGKVPILLPQTFAESA